ncbi:MAG: ParB/RepB/Spo0J family partition protein [Elusimicrobia bacterium]|nr:ParB/RepB/Spo0J family partition protein [Elusimicrobiota bacterium]
MRQALGRGLDALLPSGAQNGGDRPQIVRVAIDKVRPNHLQTRKQFDPEKLSELAVSIKQNGLAQPILVTHDPASNTYELIAGERRWRASQLAGLTEIDAVVRAVPTERERLVLNLIENLQREDLNPIEEARGYLRLMKEHSLTQVQLTEILGKSKSAVSNTLRLLDLPEEVQKALQIEQITEGHARALLAVKNQFELNKLFHVVVAQQLSVREVEDYARRIQGGETIKEVSAAPKQKKAADTIALEQALQQRLGTKVEIRTKKDPARGTVTIHFFSFADFEKIIDRLKK